MWDMPIIGMPIKWKSTHTELHKRGGGSGNESGGGSRGGEGFNIIGKGGDGDRNCGGGQAHGDGGGGGPVNLDIHPILKGMMEEIIK